MAQGGNDPALRAFYAERRGLKVNLIVNPHDPLPADKGLQALDREGRNCGLQRDSQYLSPLSGNLVRHTTPTHLAQRLARRARALAKGRFLMLSLRTAIFLKKGGKFIR